MLETIWTPRETIAGDAYRLVLCGETRVALFVVLEVVTDPSREPHVLYVELPDGTRLTELTSVSTGDQYGSLTVAQFYRPPADTGYLTIRHLRRNTVRLQVQMQPTSAGALGLTPDSPQ